MNGNTMKKVIIVTIAAIAPFVILYAMGAFVSLEPNPANWSSYSRIVFVLVGSAVSVWAIDYWSNDP
jgi:hypothetical protein